MAAERDDTDETTGAEDDGATGGKKKRKWLPYVIAGAAVLTAIFTYLLLKKPSTSSASATGAQVVTTGTTTSPTAAPSSSGGPQTVDITTPAGASYSGPPTSIPTSIKTTRGTPATPAPTSSVPTFSPSQGSASTVPYATLTPHGTGYSIGNYGYGSVAAQTGQSYTTVSTYTKTLQDLQAGTPVYTQTSKGGFQKVTTVAAFKAMEQTGHAGNKQTTTYVLSPSSAS